MTEQEIRQALFALRDEKYRAFHGKLLPTVQPERLIGVRTPQVRNLARVLAREPDGLSYLEILPHHYVEENNLHAFLIETIRDFDRAMAETEKFLPYIDNWATCDMFSPKVFRKHPQAVYSRVRCWLGSDRVYTVRYGIVTLLGQFLGENFQEEQLSLVAAACCGEYYINMAAAWYFSMALAKQWDAALPWLREERLPVWVHNKAIQKAVESYQVPQERKAYLRTLRRNGRPQHWTKSEDL